MLTLTHYINKHIGAYWYALNGTVVDSEGQTVMVGEGSAKLVTIEKAIKFYNRDNGFTFTAMHHVAKQD